MPPRPSFERSFVRGATSLNIRGGRNKREGGRGEKREREREREKERGRERGKGDLHKYSRDVVTTKQDKTRRRACCSWQQNESF